MSHRWNPSGWALGLAMVVMISGCGVGENPSSARLEKLRVTVLPDQNVERLREKNAGLLDYLATELHIETEFVPATSYDEVLGLFDGKQTDLVFFGGATFVMANLKSGAIPLVARERDHHFTSYVIVAAESKAKRLEDLKEGTFAFGSELSTSGHFMPRLYLEERGIIAETFFSEVRYSGQHDRTAYWVRDGEVESGAVNSLVVDSMFADGLLSSDDVRVLWESPPYADYVWAVRRNVNEADRIAIRDAFLGLDPANPENEKILNSARTTHFVPAAIEDYGELAQIFQRHNLSEAKVE